MGLKPIEWVDRLPSTNGRVREVLSTQPDLPHGYALAARVQTRGLGRMGRPWVTGPGQDVALSVLLRPAGDDPASLVSLPLALAMGVVDLLAGCGLDARTRWPNDVLVGGRKICGILCERLDTPAGVAVIAGVGLNVNLSAEAARGIDQPATSLATETGRPHDVAQTADRLLAALSRRYDAWTRAGFAGLRADWLRVSAGVGGAVSIDVGQATLAGTLEGFGDDGELLIREAGGNQRTVWSADRVRLDADSKQGPTGSPGPSEFRRTSGRLP
jgi:BirA family biotin operon repressor/biotin-[acetyl-CoA-carboxylase] ligase